MDWTTATKAVYTTGTVSQPVTSVTDWKIRIRPEDGIKCVLLYTDGPLQFSGLIFERNSDYFTYRDIVGATVVQDYTEVSGSLPLALTPLTLLHGADVTFRVINASGAARKWQMWLLR